jgi:hypothetical protein
MRMDRGLHPILCIDPGQGRISNRLRLWISLLVSEWPKDITNILLVTLGRSRVERRAKTLAHVGVGAVANIDTVDFLFGLLSLGIRLAMRTNSDHTISLRRRREGLRSPISIQIVS